MPKCHTDPNVCSEDNFENGYVIGLVMSLTTTVNKVYGEHNPDLSGGSGRLGQRGGCATYVIGPSL